MCGLTEFSLPEPQIIQVPGLMGGFTEPMECFLSAVRLNTVNVQPLSVHQIVGLEGVTSSLQVSVWQES